MSEPSLMTAVLKRDHLIVIAGLLLVIVPAWIYILLGARMGMSAFEMTTMAAPNGDSKTIPHPREHPASR